MTKLWCIAIAMGGPEDGMVVVSTQMSSLQEMAVAQAVSDVYRQTGTKLPLMGVNARELTREYLVEALRLIDEEEQKPAGVVQLVPPSPTPDLISQPTIKELRAQNAEWMEKSYGVRPKPPEDEPA